MGVNRKAWDKVQAEKMRAAIEAQERLATREDVRRARDSEREPPLGWLPERVRFGTEATPELRRAMGDGE